MKNLREALALALVLIFSISAVSQNIELPDAPSAKLVDVDGLLRVDNDFNPEDGNEQFLAQETVEGTTASQVNMGTLSLNLNATNATPGFHTLYAKITGGDRTRYLYAPETLKVFSSFEPPGLAIMAGAGNEPRIDVAGVPGQSVVLQSSIDFQNWLPLATNWLGSNIWSYFDTQPTADRRFYRAILQ
jgi:hypothetical protein